MDTSTTYMGLRLSHPFIAGASPLGAHLDSVRRLEDAGCAAIVLHSLFEEQVTFAATGKIHHRDPLDPAFADALAHFPAASEYPYSPAEYLDHLHRVKAAVKIPVIASLNGTTSESWLRIAHLLQEAGADGLEINIYEVVTDLDIPGAAIEHQLRDIVLELKRILKIPVAVKLSPFFAAVGNVARQIDEARADAIVMFNRFYQPDIDVRRMTAAPNLELSRSAELLLRLRWLAILHGRVRASLAVTGGVETPTDGVKAILAGAHAVQVVSAILRHGPGYFQTLRDGLSHWMDWQKCASIDAMRGKVSLQHVVDATAFERANYIRTIQSWGR
jgi:dihydroorotate dehydrogenase (fumarate)